jgi:hypothetical protein
MGPLNTQKNLGLNFFESFHEQATHLMPLEGFKNQKPNNTKDMSNAPWEVTHGNLVN